MQLAGENVLRALGLLLVAGLASACGRDPEQALLGRWQEVEWRYDKRDVSVSPESGEAGRRWIDGLRRPRHAEDGVVRHQTDYWEFKPDRVVEISLRDGRVLRSRWRLKGRGHVLTLRHAGSEGVELYDVKELTNDELVLTYDIGMEVRGIARVRLRKAESGEQRAGNPRPRGGNVG